MRDYARWHEAYDDPQSGLAARLRVVQARLWGALDAAPPGRVRLLGMCAGQGRDVLGVRAGHPRGADVEALLVELDPEIARMARAAAPAGVEVRQADASLSDVYAGWAPADVVLACGIFGNVSEADVERTVRNLPMLCAQGATVIWTRHRRAPDLTVSIRGWFDESGFEEVAFDALDNETLSGVGTHRLVHAPRAFEPAFRFFTFLR